MSKIIFKEEQRFSFWFIWVLILGVSGLMLYFFYKQIIMDIPAGDNPAPDFVIILFAILFGVGMPLFFFILKLTTMLDEKGITLNYFPLRKMFFSYSDINNIIKREYQPFNEFGGWGIKTGYKIKSYTMSGRQGIQIEFTNGNKILLGTKKPEELYSALISAKSKKN